MLTKRKVTWTAMVEVIRDLSTAGLTAIVAKAVNPALVLLAHSELGIRRVEAALTMLPEPLHQTSLTVMETQP